MEAGRNAGQEYPEVCKGLHGVILVAGRRAPCFACLEPAVSPFAVYHDLFRISGPSYVLVAFIGRLPLAMSQLGTLLLVAEATDSYAAGGAAAGALALANAVGSPIAGGLADSWGQRRVVLAQSLAGALGLLAIVLLSAAGMDWPWIAAAAGVTGFCMPQIGPLARVRWRPLTIDRAHEDDHRRLVDAAFSYEGSADEASFVLGPALVGALAALIDPAAALVTAAVLLAVFGTSFALHGTAAFVAGRGRGAAQPPARLITVGFVLLALAQLGIGVVFGSIQTGTTVLARSVDQVGMAGLLQALLGVGSVLAGIALALVPARFGYPTRLAAFASAFVVLALPLLAVDSLGWLAVVLLVLGLAIAPYMITVFTLAERLVPAERSGAAMTLLSGVTGLGYAIGSTIAGRLADEHGHQAAYAVAVAAGVAMLVLAWTARPLLARRQSAVDATPQMRSAVSA